MSETREERVEDTLRELSEAVRVSLDLGELADANAARRILTAFAKEIEEEAYAQIRERRRAKRAKCPKADGGCQCPICRWHGQIIRIKAKLENRDDIALIDDMANAIADAETMAEHGRFMLDLARAESTEAKEG